MEDLEVRRESGLVLSLVDGDVNSVD